MKQTFQWAIGLYVDGKLTGFGRWTDFTGRETQGMVISESPDAVHLLWRQSGTVVREGVTAKPVRVEIREAE